MRGQHRRDEVAARRDGEGDSSHEHGAAGAAGAVGARAVTVEELWRRHGRELERLASRVLDDTRAVDAACYGVMLRAGEWLETSRRAVPRETARWWLRDLCADVCGEILADGVPSAWLTDDPLPEALPTRVRSALGFQAARRRLDRVEAMAPTEGPVARARQRQRARWREALEEQLRGLRTLVPLALLAQLARKAWDGAERAGRDVWRRVEVAASTAMPPGQRVAGLLSAGPGFPEAAAVVTAFVAVGVAAPEPPPRATPIDGREVASTLVERREERTAASDAASSEALTHPDGDELAASTPSPRPEADGDASPEPDPGPGLPTPGPDAEVDADPGGAADEPVEKKHRSHGTKYQIASHRAGVDVDGDGEDEVWVKGSVFNFHCRADPSRRGPVSSQVCPVLADSEVVEESELITEEEG